MIIFIFQITNSLFFGTKIVILWQIGCLHFLFTKKNSNFAAEIGF